MKDRLQTALFMKPGQGKTATTLTALDDLQAFPALVVAPIRVCETVWAQEAGMWEHLCHLRFALIRGTPAKRHQKLSDALAGGADILLINYELLPWLTAETDCLVAIKAIIWDELSMMKSPGARRFKAIRSQIHNIDIRLGLTGTPAGNSLLNLWGELYVCAGTAPLGHSYVKFRRQYFNQAGTQPPLSFIWNPKTGAQEQLLARIRPYAITIKPSREPDTLLYNQLRVNLPPKVRKQYAKLATEFTAKFGDEDVLSANAMVNGGKLRQVASGAIYLEKPFWEELHMEKLKALSDLVEELEGAPLLLFYEFVHERERIARDFPAAEFGMSEDIERRWNLGEIPLLCLQPQEGAHGLNLQYGGCDVAWFTPPWSWELWCQGIARLYGRHGQRRAVTVHTLLAQDTKDEDVLNALHRHGAVERSVLSATT